MQNMIEIIYPDNVRKEEKILELLSDYGIHHLDPDPKTGWNYALDHFWLSKQIEKFLVGRQGQNIICLDVGCGNSKFHNFLEDRFGIFIIGIDRIDGYCKQEILNNVNYVGDFLSFDRLPENSADIIFWLSSIEHNELQTIQSLYEKSMQLLKPGGLFLATIALAEKSSWFEQAQQTNLDLTDVQKIFGPVEVLGDFNQAFSQYQNDVLLLRQRYQNRYGEFTEKSPEYIVAGIRCEKGPLGNAEMNPGEALVAAYPITFIPSNDTHVHWMTPIANLVEAYQFMVFPERKENADSALQSTGHPYFQYAPGLFSVIRTSLVVLGNDWGKEEQEVIRECRILGIPSICIQEGPLHFSNTKFYLQNADFAFLQGEVMKKYVGNQNAVITGNPKYDQLQKLPLPSRPCVMVNCNFTYGIYEEYRDQWLKDIIRACQELQVDYFISQHPRDTGILPDEYNVVRSNAFLVNDQIKKSTLLVSRFSTLIYEALLMGRGVVYYDPMHESFRLIKENNNGAIYYGDDYESLKNALKQALENSVPASVLDEFLNVHCNLGNGRATQNCVREINKISLQSSGQRKEKGEFDKSRRLVNDLTGRGLLSPSHLEVQPLSGARLSPKINDDHIIHFVEHLSERAAAQAVVINDPKMLGFRLRYPTGSIVLIPDGIKALKDFPQLVDPLIEMSKKVQKIIILDDIDSFRDISQIKDLSSESKLPIEFLGYFKDIHGALKYVTILSHEQPQKGCTAPDDFRVVAIISTYNEGDVIIPVIKNLARNKISAYVIDNWSTDGTFEKIQQLPGSEVLGIERWPSSGPSSYYDWIGILKRKEELAGELNADWFIHHDADEIRESPWETINLRDAIFYVDQIGYSAIDFTVLDFPPVDDGYLPGSSLEDHFRYFKFGLQIADFMQIKAWKKTGKPVDLSSTAGHIAEFTNKRVFPYKFLLKHYPIRSQEHGQRKIFQERKPRWSRAEIKLGWHTHYGIFDSTTSFLKNPKGLIPFDQNFYSDFLLERLSGVGIVRTAEIGKKIESLNSRLMQMDEQNKQLFDELSRKKEENLSLSDELSRKKGENISLTDEILTYALSKSWRLTRPFRKISRKLKGK